MDFAAPFDLFRAGFVAGMLTAIALTMSVMLVKAGGLADLWTKFKPRK